MHHVEINCDCCRLSYEQGPVFDGLSEEAREELAVITNEALHAVAMAVAQLALVESMDEAELVLGSLNQCMAILAEACNHATGEDGAMVLEDEPVRYGMYL